LTELVSSLAILKNLTSDASVLLTFLFSISQTSLLHEAVAAAATLKFLLCLFL
jgi:hypothetical protein